MNIYKIVFENKFTPSRFYKSEKIAKQQYACYTLMGEPCILIALVPDDYNQGAVIEDEILVSGVVKYVKHKEPEITSISAGFIADYGVMRDEIKKYGATNVGFFDPTGYGNRISFTAFIKMSEFKNEEDSSYNINRIKDYIRDGFIKWRKENVMYKVTDKSGTINYYFDTMKAAKAALPCIKLTGDKFTISEIKPDILNTSTIEAVAVISKPSNIMSCIDFRPVYLTDPMIDGSEYEINMHYKDTIFSVSEFDYCASCRMRVKVGDLFNLNAEKERIKGELMDAFKTYRKTHAANM